MTSESDQETWVEEAWREFLTAGVAEAERRQRYVLRLLPGAPRCKRCYTPLQGPGRPVARVLYGKEPSNLNPYMCNMCEQFASTYQGGADVELSLLFADVRGSTSIAESMSPMEFSKLINRFFKTATRILARSDALIDKIVGDQAAGIYVPGLAGPQHASRAVSAAIDILRSTGHSRTGSPWIPLGVGIHTGNAYVGSVGSEEASVDITVLGDAPNTAARLASSAFEGEILISSPAYEAAGMVQDDLEKRTLSLKGKREPVIVYVLTV